MLLRSVFVRLHTLYRMFGELEVACAVIAPSLIPRKAGGCIKTTRRDAKTLARRFASGLLTECFVPGSE